MEIIQSILVCLNTIVAFAAVIALVRNPMKKKANEVKEKEELQEAREIEHIETDNCTLRYMMTNIYYKNYESRTIREFEYESFAHMYEHYKKLGGNSFIDRLWEEMRLWRIEE